MARRACCARRPRMGLPRACWSGLRDARDSRGDRRGSMAPLAPRFAARRVRGRRERSRHRDCIHCCTWPLSTQGHWLTRTRRDGLPAPQRAPATKGRGYHGGIRGCRYEPHAFERSSTQKKACMASGPQGHRLLSTPAHSVRQRTGRRRAVHRLCVDGQGPSLPGICRRTVLHHRPLPGGYLHRYRCARVPATTSARGFAPAHREQRSRRASWPIFSRVSAQWQGARALTYFFPTRGSTAARLNHRW
mmetsp:Transcript_19097/g.51337  ORF Transcript_19097/g.51337 Transcript_19097/m.51337 type:complete len:247 (+) Transcript_19097:1401-2141(+)